MLGENVECLAGVQVPTRQKPMKRGKEFIPPLPYTVLFIQSTTKSAKERNSCALTETGKK